MTVSTYLITSAPLLTVKCSTGLQRSYLNQDTWGARHVFSEHRGGFYCFTPSFEDFLEQVINQTGELGDMSSQFQHQVSSFISQLNRLLRGVSCDRKKYILFKIWLDIVEKTHFETKVYMCTVDCRVYTVDARNLAPLSCIQSYIPPPFCFHQLSYTQCQKELFLERFIFPLFPTNTIRVYGPGILCDYTALQFVYRFKESRFNSKRNVGYGNLCYSCL